MPAGRLVEDQVEVAEGINDEWPPVLVQLPDRGDLLGQEFGANPQAMLPGPVEWLVLNLPGHQRRVLTIPKNGVLHEDHGGIAERRIQGDVHSVLLANRHHRGGNVELRRSQAPSFRR